MKKSMEHEMETEIVLPHGSMFLDQPPRSCLAKRAKLSGKHRIECRQLITSKPNQGLYRAFGVGFRVKGICTVGLIIGLC